MGTKKENTALKSSSGNSTESSFIKYQKAFTALLDNNFDAVILINTRGIILWSSEKSSKYLLGKKQKIIDKDIFALLGTPRSSIFKKYITSAKRKKNTVSWEENNKKNILKYTIQPIIEDLNKISILFICIEISLLPKKNITTTELTDSTEKKISISEERFRLFAENTTAIICEFDMQRKFVYVNPAFQKTFGFNTEEIIGQKVDIYLHPDDLKQSVENYNLMKKQKILTSQIRRIRNKSGEWRSLQSSANISSGYGGYQSIIVVATDITEQLKIEADLKNRTEDLDRFFSLALDLLCIADTNGYFHRLNRAWEKILGYTIEELEGRKFLDFVHPEDIPATMEAISRLTDQENVIGFINRYRHRDGSYSWIEWYTAPSGKLIYTAARDITKQKYNEERLKLSETRYRKLVNSITNYIYTVNIEDEQPISTIHSPGCFSVTGYTPEEYAADSDLWHKIIYDEDKNAVTEQTELVMLGKESKPLEHRIIHKNGEIRWIKNVVVPRFIDNKLVSYDGLISDITDQKKAEEALRLSEEKYRDIFENAIEGIFQSSPEGKFINVNPAFASMLGYGSPQEIIDTITDIQNQLYVNPSDRDYVIKKYNESGAIQQHEVEMYRKDSSKIWVSLSGRITKDSKGNILYYEGTAENITERKLNQEEKEKLQYQLYQSQKMEALGTFTGGVAHDFNNILSVLMGYANLMQMDIDEKNPLRTNLDLIVSSAEKAANLTKSLLAFSRKEPINLRPINLNDAIRGTYSLLKRLFSEDIKLTLNCTDKKTIIMGDSTQIDQLLFNFATNAMDAMPKGGNFKIETNIIYMEKEFTSSIGHGVPGKYVMLSVIDTGKGMDFKTTEQIFDPFYTTKEAGKGTGLGLSTVYGIIKQHKGHIIVYSEPDIGTNFRIYFPAISEKIKKDKNTGAAIRYGDETILVAEDDSGVRSLITIVLSRYGYLTIEAKDGNEAVNIFKEKEDIDLLILDSVMPGKNGREVYEIIKNIKPQIKVIFISGYTRDIVLDKGIEEKKVNFLSKPLEPNILVQKVRDVLDKKTYKK